MARVKQKLKEPGNSSQQKRESFTKLFANAQNLPVMPEQKADQGITKSLMASVPTPAQETKPRMKKAPKPNGVSSGWFLLVPAIGLTTFVLLTPSERNPSLNINERPLAEYEKPEFREKVDFHRKSTGWKMNNERIEADLENRIQSSELPTTAMPVPKDGIMKGLPLAGERNPHQIDETPQMMPEMQPDANVLYQVSREQRAAEFDKAARREFIRELKANAAQAGYKVEVDADGNARFTRLKRRPSSGSDD